MLALLRALRPAALLMGRFIFASATYGGTADIYEVNADGSDLVNLTNQQGGFKHPAWSPDGSKIVFGSEKFGNSDIYVMDANGDNQINLTSAAGESGANPVWSPDGTQIAFSSSGDQIINIMLVNSDGSDPHILTDTAAPYGTLMWSPDGSQIAFSSWPAGAAPTRSP